MVAPHLIDAGKRPSQVENLSLGLQAARSYDTAPATAAGEPTLTACNARKLLAGSENVGCVGLVPTGHFFDGRKTISLVIIGPMLLLNRD